MEPVYDSSLETHLHRIEGYMRGCAILAHPRARGPQRTELAAFLSATIDDATDAWVRIVGPALGIPESDWSDLRRSMRDALVRWVRHIEDPDDIETYVYLRSHAHRDFISQFPPSRFLSGQMKIHQILAERLDAAYCHDPERRQVLQALFQQEFAERILYISDFFVEARERELREQEASYRKSIDNAPAAIFRVDHQFGTILDANLVGEKLVKQRRAELIGTRLYDLMPTGERTRAMQLLDEARSRGHSSREDLHLQTRDGELMPVYFNVGLIEYGAHHFFQVICVDTSDRRRLETQLIQSEKMAAIGQLAAGIAHEIRNPLGIIMNALYDLGEIVDASDPEIKEDLRIAKEEMDRVQAIINNLLEFSRESRAEVETVDINDLLRRTLQLMSKSLQNSDVRVITDFGPLGTCQANQNAMRQIFLNLITNAVQAMPAGGELRLRTVPLPGGRIQLEFSDTGVGIPPEHLRDIFNPFFTTKAPGQGTGLGLSVVHSVVKRYQGDIQVRSQLNRGTTSPSSSRAPARLRHTRDLSTVPHGAMRAAPRTLLVEDEANMVRTLTKILERKGYAVDAASTGEEALQRLGEREYDLLITDLNMPVLDGMQLLREMNARHFDLPTIVLTGHGTIQSAVEAMKLGAGDYLIKPCNPDELLLVAARLLELRRLRREVTQLKRQLQVQDRFGEIVGTNPRMREIYQVIDAVSQNKSNVLISGENGTGKELIARTIHNKGPFASKPFLAINCGALSETLLESQLFGHRKGAFTGAIDDHEGVFQAAEGGTLFLDEIVEIPLPLQVKFLRAIQEKEVTPLGSTRPVRVDVRIIAATNRDLESVVRSGSFRTDLFYRLNVVPVHLPPLRERREDIQLLVEHFVQEFSRVYGVAPKRVTPEALARIVAYDWPGNIRELQNAIERAFALSAEPEITLRDLPPAVLRGGEHDGVPSLAEPIRLEELEKQNILAALQRSGGNKNEAARILGIDRQRLYRKMEKYGLG